MLARRTSTPAQWTWMKRYRVWQANREVFLWPENWLYPELRDDQSPFFQQTMSSCCRATSPTTRPQRRTSTTSPTWKRSRSSSRAACTTCPGTGRRRRDLPTWWRAPPGRTASTTSASSRAAAGRRGRRCRSTARTCRSRPSSGTAGCSCSGSRSLKQASARRPTPLASYRQRPDLASMQVGDLKHVQPARRSGYELRPASAQCCAGREYYNGTWQPTKTSDVNLPTQHRHLRRSPGSDSFEACAEPAQIVPAQVTGTNPRGGLREVSASYASPCPRSDPAGDHPRWRGRRSGRLHAAQHAQPADRIDDIDDVLRSDSRGRPDLGVHW